MTAVMTKELSQEACEAIRQGRIDRYQKLGFTREKYEREIVKGCKLPWKSVKAKSFALSCYREETGVKPAEKVEHDLSGSLMAAVAAYLSGQKNDPGKQD